MKRPDGGGEIREAQLADALGERYLSYALSTIMARSLPDVRDGLKPVHRRLLYAMRQLKLDPDSGYKKSARVVGDVIGKYHPHGDTAVYDALVRLAQDFAVRFPLIDGQGNFGNIDGDNAAAMRYTEARMTAIAQALLDGIDEDAVDFRPTYDGEEQEPVVLPAAFPNLLANGSTGIAVGMATNIPPHNVAEICDALTLLLKKQVQFPDQVPDVSFADLLEAMPGPDFPTGGVLVEPRETIIETYSTGRGSFRLRARWHAEPLTHGQYRIVVSEIPYQVQKSRLIEKIAELLNAKKLPLLEDVHDESTETVCLVLTPKNRSTDPEMLMESLFRHTDLETRFGLNMNVLDADNTPRVMNLREVLQAFLDHRHVVLERRARFRLERIERRLEVLEGYLIAYLNLDEVIRIIREEDDPKAVMMARFGLTDNQVEAILNMRLRALRKLEEIAIRKEHDQLSAEKAKLEELLGDVGKRWKAIGAEIAKIRKSFGKDTALGRRRTELGAAPSVLLVPPEAMIEREPLTILCSAKGWIRALKGHVADTSDQKYKDGDGARFTLLGETTDKLVIFATDGRFYTLGADKLPKGRGHGEPLRLMLDLANDCEVVAMILHKPDRKLLIASNTGRGFLVEEAEVIAQTRAGKQVLNLEATEQAKICMPAEGDAVAVVGENRKMVVFRLTELPVMTRGKGVTLQKYKDGGLSDVKVFNLADGLSWKMGERTRTETDLRRWLAGRGGSGYLAPNGFPRGNRFTA